MAPTLFIAPGDGAVGRAIATRALAAEFRVYATVPQMKKPSRPASPEEAKGDAAPVPWNVRSPLSARNALLAALNAGDRIDNAVLIYTSTRDRQPLHEISPVAIERAVDAQLTGNLFILKELLGDLMRRQSGTLSLVSFAPGDYTRFPLDAVATAAFRALAESLFAVYQGEKFAVHAFESARDDPDGFAEFIVDILSSRAPAKAKWHRYGGGPFSRGR